MQISVRKVGYCRVEDTVYKNEFISAGKYIYRGEIIGHKVNRIKCSGQNSEICQYLR